ncbi:hypothetical protein M427DRAFT_131366 [Gonapodya prolifera JEL478]|uniref:Uncharacterized protein n=1 Tax=Gonapodya prolifera (strain JEL478) TaxID=1344416 RepID=A0A139AV27_GONPJ|nr:hypothetical protein M427DRAFT_131366 [Gonapodya prolifera JEL478]|eukprot:KXS20596.1 hypothetical protein M427DRAFT_131366 [Gonapodya prolifera JEL478]
MEENREQDKLRRIVQKAADTLIDISALRTIDKLRPQEHLERRREYHSRISQYYGSPISHYTPPHHLATTAPPKSAATLSPVPTSPPPLSGSPPPTTVVLPPSSTLSRLLSASLLRQGAVDMYPGTPPTAVVGRLGGGNGKEGAWRGFEEAFEEVKRAVGGGSGAAVGVREGKVGKVGGAQ